MMDGGISLIDPVTGTGLRNRETIAGAVAREIDRIVRAQDHVGEGSAYKAAFDRKGSAAHKHCEAAKRDRLAIEEKYA